MGTGIAIGLGVGLVLGIVLGAVLIRYGCKLHEQIEYGVRDETPVFTPRDAPYEHDATDADSEG